MSGSEPIRETRTEFAPPCLLLLLQNTVRSDPASDSITSSCSLTYYFGFKVGRDYAEAVRWYRRAAEQGLAVAQTNLGWMYEEGRGVRRDYAEAVRWYRRAVDQGHAGGQNSLGRMYENGRGVERDRAEAVRLYRLAAEQGDRLAQENLDRLRR